MKPKRRFFVLVALSFLPAVSAHAQFTRGNLTILQVGDGFGAVGGAGAPLLIREFSISANQFGFHVALPTNGAEALVLGNNAFTGSLALSADGASLVIAGYNVPLPYTNSTSIDSSTNTTVPRAIASVDYAGNYSLNVTTTNAFNRGTIRGGVSDGRGNYWAGGAADGIQYLGTNASPLMVGGAGAGAIRDILMVNGAIYYSSSQFPVANSSGVVMFTNGAPITASSSAQRRIINTTSNAIPGSTGVANPKGFAINSSLTRAYVVDMRSTANGGGIYRFNGDGQFGSTNWDYAYTIPSSVGAIQDIAVDFSRTDPIIYAIAGTGLSGQPSSLVAVTDVGAGSTFTVLANAPGSALFRGISWAPVEPIVMSIRLSGGNAEIRWSGGGILQSANFVTGPWTDIEGAISPYLTDAGLTNEFFRVSQ